MNQRKLIILSILAVVLLFLTNLFSKNADYVKKTLPKANEASIVSGKFDEESYKTDKEWQELLTDEQYYILRQAGTERPYSGALNTEKHAGTYYSAGCDKPLFRSEQKYDSKTGWPSFWAPIDADSLVLSKDYVIGYERIEVLDTCGNHLGHLFNDGPEPTGERYCMNSIALRFVPDE